MAAPQSCWIEWNDDSEEAEFFHAAPTGGPNDVRYLRADLKCGGCSLTKEDSWDRSLFCEWKTSVGTEDPACMGFVPLQPDSSGFFAS